MKKPAIIKLLTVLFDGERYILGPKFGFEAQLKNYHYAGVSWTAVTSDKGLIAHLIAYISDGSTLPWPSE